MTLDGHFTLKFHYYEQRFHILNTYRKAYRIFLLYHATSRDVRKRTVIRRYIGFVEGLRIFRRREVVGATSSEPEQIRPTLLYSIT